MTSAGDALLQPFTLKGVTFRNRVMSTSHGPGYAEAGMPGQRYQLYHAEKAKGGIGLTMFGGVTTFTADALSLDYNRLYAGDDRIIPHFQAFAERIHGLGARLMCQLTHVGRRARWNIDPWLPPVAPSRVREPFHRSHPKPMEPFDFKRIIAGYGAAARRCKEGGLDGCQIQGAFQNLFDSFWSPIANKRTDRYGGSLENRCRFGLEVFAEVRKEVGDDFIVGLRMTGDELLESGLDHQAMLEIGRIFAESGMVDFFDIVGGTTWDLKQTSQSMANMTTPPALYLGLASAFKRELGVTVFHGLRITDLSTARRAVQEGHLDMVSMTRGHIADPHIVRKLTEGREDDIRECVGATWCVDRRLVGQEALCLQNAATGREATMPHEIEPTTGPRRKVVVVGAGPGGLEAARVSATRGHEVVLFEKAAKVGGQINTAARGPKRESLSGIARWLDGQVRKLGVDLRLGTEATAAMVLAEAPDVVVIATGGDPDVGPFEGAELAVTTWDILDGRVEPGENVLVYDDDGREPATLAAEMMGARGAKVELVTPDRQVNHDSGLANLAHHMSGLYEGGVALTVDMRVTQVYREGNKLVAVLRNTFTGAEEERAVDQVVAEHGTIPRDAIYHALTANSRNLGEIDLYGMASGTPQPILSNAGGTFELYRVGDAVSSRNIHAAIYDSLRICKGL